MNIIDQKTGFKIDLYPAGDDDFTKWAFENKKLVELIADEEVYVAPPEYVIINKLAFFKEGGSQKHIEDIEGMLQVSGDKIDISLINRWSSRLSLEDEWASVGE